MFTVTGSNPAVHVRFFLLAFGALGRKSQRAQKGELCAAALAEVASLGVGRGSLIFSPIFFDACFAVYNARRLLGSKTWISATLHRQGPRPQTENGLRSEKRPFWHHGRSRQTHFQRFFQARPARKLRLTDPKCSCAATQISPTRLKPPKTAVFVTISPQSAFLRISLCQPVGLDLNQRLRANIGCGTWLVPGVASRRAVPSLLSGWQQTPQ